MFEPKATASHLDSTPLRHAHWARRSPTIRMSMPGGISLDRERWVACRPNFFLPVRVLSRLFRRLVLERLDAAHRAGQL